MGENFPHFRQGQHSTRKSKKEAKASQKSKFSSALNYIRKLVKLTYVNYLLLKWRNGVKVIQDGL